MIIQFFRILMPCDIEKIPKTKWILIVLKYFLKTAVEPFIVHSENCCRVDSQGTVHKNIDSRQFAAVVKVVQRINHLLRATDAEGRNDQLTLLFDTCVHYCCKKLLIHFLCFIM